MTKLFPMLYSIKCGDIARSRSIRQILVAVLAVALLQIAVISTGYAAPPADGYGWGGGGGNCNTYHTVRYGQTLFSIGRQYGVYPYRIAQANGLYNPDRIYAGQVLYIPCGSGRHGGDNCCNSGWQGNCCDSGWQGGDNCCNSGRQGNCCNYRPPQVGYGYDYTGYYYESYYPQYRRYSYTCGYHYNCY